MVSQSLYNSLDINIDRYLNPYIPPNPLHHLPQPISHFLGYRYHPSKDPPTTIQWLLTLLSTFSGICLIGVVFNYAPGIAAWNPPTIVASLGASAILDYNMMRSPLAQPRNAVVGHTITAIVGVCVAKLFMFAPEFLAQYDWVAAAVACAVASVAMSMTRTVYPPGGATAILACTEKQIVAMGWRFPPLVLVGSLLALGVACLWNNTLRQYPVFWWTPEDVGSKLPQFRRRKAEDSKEVEHSSLEAAEFQKQDFSESSNSEKTLTRELSHEIEFLEGLEAIHVTPYMVSMPPYIQLRDGEAEVLQALMMRLRTHVESQQA